MAIDKTIRDKAEITLNKSADKIAKVKVFTDQLDAIESLLMQLQKDTFEKVKIVISDSKFDVKDFLNTSDFKTYIIGIVESKYSELSLLLDKVITNGK